jgi:hypothetical protein
MHQTLAMVSDFWSTYDCRINTDEPPILIDLLHGITEYLWRNLPASCSFARKSCTGAFGK